MNKFFHLLKLYFLNEIKRLTAFFNYIGGIVSLSAETLFWVFIPPFKKERFLIQAKRVGQESLPIVSIVAIFVGMILALQTAYQMKKLSSEIYIANILSVSLFRELGPVLTALVVAGRIGASIAAEIGTMNVTEQVDALHTLATNPVRYLVVPRFLSLAMMLPLLTIYSNLIGVLGGYLICVLKIGIPGMLYLNMSFDALVLKDLFTGLFKTVVFGAIIALVGCYEGLRTEGGAEGVGKATTQAVVKMFILIIIADCFFASLFYFVLG